MEFYDLILSKAVVGGLPLSDSCGTRALFSQSRMPHHYQTPGRTQDVGKQPSDRAWKKYFSISIESDSVSLAVILMVRSTFHFVRRQYISGAHAPVTSC